MNAIFQMTVSATGPGASLNVKLDGQSRWQGELGIEPSTVSFEIDDDQEAQHQLVIEMSGKTQEHTRIDEQGNIISDLLVNIKDVTLDDIPLDPTIPELAIYQHDFNGNGPETTENFYGTMGCNGTITLPFYTPIYLWLLEIA